MGCVDFASLRRGPGLDLIFPGWRAGERVFYFALLKNCRTTA
jgi:hypothetical protein